VCIKILAEEGVEVVWLLMNNVPHCPVLFICRTGLGFRRRCIEIKHCCFATQLVNTEEKNILENIY